MTTGKALNGKPLVVLCAIASLCGMFAGDVFAAGPTHATVIDVKCAETIPGGRVVLPMNDGWEFKWGKDKSVGEWKSVDLPHDAQFEQPWTQKDSNGARGFKPMGEMWYRKRLALPGEMGNWERGTGKRVFLEFGGLLCVGDVYVNGKNVGGTDYGYLPVWCDITDALKADGDNVVEVWCSTGQLGGSRWYTGAGLYRGAKLVVKPKVSIARHGVFVRSHVEGGSRGRSTSRDADAVISLTVELDGFRGMGNKVALDVIADIKDASGKVVATATARAPWSKLRHQEVEMPEIALKDAKLWDIDSPNLYTADVRLVYNGSEIDRDAVRFGVRKIEMDHDYGLKLNGRKVFLASISNHHDLGLVGAAAYPRAIRRQFETMKKFGYNAIRCSHNPYSEEFYDLADEMGLLVLDELIDKWSDRSCWFGRRPFTQIWPQLVTDWIKRDRNHPSVFAWSFGNELQMNEDLCGYQCLGDWGVTMYRLMKTLAQRWDPTRATTVAMYPARSGARGGRDPVLEGDPIPPELACVTDFASFNYKWADYAGYVKHEPQMNIFQSEAVVGQRQAPFLGMDREHSIGCSWWGAVEYWGESNGWPKKGWSHSFFSHTLEPFPVAYLIKSVICPESPVVEIAVPIARGESEEWNDVKVGSTREAAAWEGVPGKSKEVKVYTNCREVELFLNGKSIGAKPNDGATPRAKNVVVFKVPFEPGTLEARGKVSGSEDVVASVATAGEAVEMLCSVEADDYIADGMDLVYVKCYAVDKNGNQVCGYTGKVSFSCEGAAKFLACDNGDHYTDELFTSDLTAKRAKDGFILAAFRTRTIPGEAKITIKPEGLPVVSLTVPVGRKTADRNEGSEIGEKVF